MLTPAYRHLVTGSGAAGVAAVGALLHFSPPQTRIAWVDPDFTGGRLSKRYRDVSSNTKVKLFLNYAEALQPFNDVIASTPKPNAITALQDLDQERGCRLSYAADAIQMLATGLRRHPRVDTILGTVAGAEHDGSRWHVHTNTTTSNSETKHAETSSLILCTGSSPSRIPLPTSTPQQIDLDSTLDRAKLRALLPSSQPTTIGIIGTSHSAIVVLMNLFSLYTSTHPHLRVRWFVRSGLQYAEEMDGWILRDNTGLKGASADFAREHLEPDKLASSPVGGMLETVHCPDASDPGMKGELEKCEFVVQAIGYTRDKLPELRVEGGRRVGRVGWDQEVGYLMDEGDGEGEGKGKRLPGAYGAGIAWPRRTVDPRENVEYAVGMWKFMR